MIRPEEIAARIRELCDERDINNYKLSKASGISMSALSHMFNRQTIPNVTTLIRICDGLGITLNELFDYGGLDRVHLTDETVRLLDFWNQLDSTEPVSYTHLDVYKRQARSRPMDRFPRTDRLSNPS